jgi:tetratricopeptide (TPR) repeat protein
MRRLFVTICGFLVVMAGLLWAEPQEHPASPASSVTQQALKLAQTGHCAEALPGLKKAITATDQDTKRKAGLAGVRCAMTMNQPDSALAFLQMLTRSFPHDPDVLYLSVHAYSDLSTRASQELAIHARSSYQAHELNAEAFEEQGKWDEAAKEYRAILEQNPDLPGIHFRLGRLLLSKPDPGPNVAEDARKEMELELQIDPSNAGAEYVLGELARQQGQWPEAIEHLSRAIKLDAGFGDAYLGLGASLLSAKRFAEAIAPLQTAVKLEPQNPGAHYNLAVAFSRSGRKEDADREFAVHRQMTQNQAGQAPPASEQPANPN